MTRSHTPAVHAYIYIKKYVFGIAVEFCIESPSPCFSAWFLREEKTNRRTDLWAESSIINSSAGWLPRPSLGLSSYFPHGGYNLFLNILSTVFFLSTTAREIFKLNSCTFQLLVYLTTLLKCEWFTENMLTVWAGANCFEFYDNFWSIFIWESLWLILLHEQ